MNDRTLTRAHLTEALHDEVGLTAPGLRRPCRAHAGSGRRSHGKRRNGQALGFGVFEVRSKRERMGEIQRPGAPATIEPRRVIGFRASQVIKARIDNALAK